MKLPIQMADFHFIDGKKNKKVAKDIFVVYDSNGKLTDYDRRLQEAYRSIFPKTSALKNFEKRSLRLIKIDVKESIFGYTSVYS